MHVVAVTGGRDYSDKKRVFSVLDTLHKEHPIHVLVHGAATGVDTFADYWADKRGVFQCRLPVTGGLWSRHGKPAGVIRNSYMLKVCRPNILVAFPGNRGTSNCVATASKLGIRIIDHRKDT
jgi:hypothetical protein